MKKFAEQLKRNKIGFVYLFDRIEKLEKDSRKKDLLSDPWLWHKCLMPIRLHLVMSALILAITACATVLPVASPFDSHTFLFSSVNISVEALDEHSWRVLYRTDVPVRALYFEDSSESRIGRWRTESGQFILENISGREGLHRRDGAFFSEASLTFDDATSETHSGYAFLLPFTDGSHAFYSTHFLVHGSNLKTQFKFKPLAGQHVFVRNKEMLAAQFWASPSKANLYGEYFYFGKDKPQNLGSLDGLLDPGLPPWILSEIQTQILPAYRQLVLRLGESPSGRPFLIVNRWPKPNDLQHFVAGEGKGWVYVDLQGQDWNNSTPEGQLKFYITLTHELSHMWTSQERDDFQRINWMNEGGANAFANLIALKAKVISKKVYLERLNASARLCVDAREKSDVPLNDQSGGKDLSLSYDCGFLVHAALNSAITKKNREADLFTFWKRLLHEAQITQGLYDDDLYFKIAKPWLQESEMSLLKNFVTNASQKTALQTQVDQIVGMIY